MSYELIKLFVTELSFLINRCRWCQHLNNIILRPQNSSLPYWMYGPNFFNFKALFLHAVAGGDQYEQISIAQWGKMMHIQLEFDKVHGLTKRGDKKIICMANGGLKQPFISLCLNILKSF